MASPKAQGLLPFLTPDDIRALAALPASAALWVGGRRRLPDRRPAIDACFWIDVEANEVRGFDEVAPGTHPDALLRLLVRAMRTPEAGQAPECPHAVASDDPRLKDFLAPLEIEVRSAPRTLIDQMFDGMLDLLSEGISAGYLSRDGVKAATVRTMLDAAARLAARAPWRHTTERELVRIEGLRDAPLFVSLDGAESDEPALAVFATEQDARALIDAPADDDLDARDLPPHLVICFEHDGVEAIRDEAHAQGAPLAPEEAVPVVMRSDESNHGLAGETDLQLAADVLALLAELDLSSSRPVDVRVDTKRLIWPHDSSVQSSHRP